MDMCVSSFLIDSGVLSRGLPGSPGGESLSFASPKESNQRKGDPQSGPLRGSLKKLKEPENLETSRLCRRRTSRFFNPSPSAFSSPARTGWGNRLGGGVAEPSPLPSPRGRGRKSESEFIPPNPWRGGEERRKKRIRARTCLSEASLCVTPLFTSTAACPKRSAGTQTAGRLSFP